MKKNFLTIIAVMLCMISVSTAQTTMEWSDYKIQFTFSDDLQELTNTSDNYVAASPSKDFVISLGPCDYSGVDEKTMGELLTQTALQDLGINIDDAEIEEFTCVKGAGVYIIGTNRDGQLCLMALALSKATKKALFVAEFFSEERAKEAGMVLGSITFK